MILNNYKEECGIIVKFWEDHFDEYRDSFVRKGSLEPVIEDLVVTVYMKKCEQILAYSWLQGGWVAFRERNMSGRTAGFMASRTAFWNDCGMIHLQRKHWKRTRLGMENVSSLLYMLCYAKSLQSFPTLCDPIDGSPPGAPVPGILQSRTLEWAAICFSNAWKWKVKVKSLSRVRL